ncbi:MAG: TonB-dependent receptor [Pseudomonadales bacterium]|nr:TonB-dependent receptor [Pseudomonadales bacterium]
MSNHRMLRFAIALALAPVATLAQDSAPPSSASQQGGLQEIVVTAERREASLQSVPIAVTALNEEALANRQVLESRDLERFTPSLKMLSNITSPTNLSPSLRGSLQQDASQIVAESPFGIYVDDVYLARLNGNNITLADIERVEVLRGPQGTLYGRNTLVGAIKFISRTPGKDSWLKGSVGVGDFDQYRGSFSAGGMLGDSNWAGSFSALLTHKDGTFQNVNPSAKRELGFERNWATRAKLRYMGVENLDVTLSFSYANSKNDSQQLTPGITPNVPANQRFTSDDIVTGVFTDPMNPASFIPLGTFEVYTPIVPGGGPGPIESVPRGETKQIISSLNISYDLRWGTFKSITGFVNTKDFFSTDFSGSGGLMGGNQLDVDQLSEELQLVGTALDDRLSYIAGLYFFNEKGYQDFGWRAGVLPFSTTRSDAKTTSYSAFTQLDYDLTDALKVTAGVRYTRDRKDFDFTFNGLLPPVTPALGVVDLTNTYTQTTPKVGIDWTVPVSDSFDSLLLYATAAQGFKSGGYNGIGIAGFIDAETPYGPETNWTYEVGIKTDMLDNRLRVNANYFYEKAKDLTLNATVENAPGIFSFPVQNAGDATVQGLEFEVTAVATDNLTLFMNGSLLDGKYDRLDPTAAPAQAITLFNIDKPSVPQTPDYTVTVGFDYGIDTAVGRVKLGADWFFQDSYITGATNDFQVQPYNIGNAFATVSFDKWTARATVKNLQNREIFATGSRGLGGFIPLPRRTWLLSLEYSMN